MNRVIFKNKIKPSVLRNYKIAKIFLKLFDVIKAFNNLSRTFNFGLRLVFCRPYLMLYSYNDHLYLT